MKKRIHILETLVVHELIDKNDENDCYLETYDIIPIKAERKKRRKKKKRSSSKKKQWRNFNETAYFHSY